MKFCLKDCLGGGMIEAEVDDGFIMLKMPDMPMHASEARALAATLLFLAGEAAL